MEARIGRNIAVSPQKLTAKRLHGKIAACLQVI